MKNYKKVYEGSITGLKVHDVLETLYMKFNTKHPTDFRGHSLSISDLVELTVKGESESKMFYCDQCGYREIEKGDM